MNIKVELDELAYALCGSKLSLIIEGKEWDFSGLIQTGGCVSFDENWSEEVTTGEWGIWHYPDGFPKEFEEEALRAINEHVPHGCCGGCV